MISARPKVLHVITSLAVGGAQRHLLRLLGGLSAEFECDLVYFKDDNLLADFERSAVRVRRFDLGARPSPVEFARLVAHVRRGNYDLVHTHLLRADGWGALAARLAGVRTVVSTKHNAEEALRDPFFATVHGLVCRLDARVIVISSHVAEYMATVGRVGVGKMAVIHYGLDPAPLPGKAEGLRARIGFGIPAGAPLVLCAARLDPQKDHPTLLKAWSTVVKAEPGAKLILAGGPQRGGEVYAAGLKDFATDLGLGGNVIFAGTRRDIPDLLAASDVLAMSSRWEGLGLVFLEAMGAARPVVATRVGGVPEIVEEGVTGLLVKPGSPDELAQALLELLRDRPRARAMGEAGRRRLGTAFSASEMVRKTANLYAGLLGR